VVFQTLLVLWFLLTIKSSFIHSFIICKMCLSVYIIYNKLIMINDDINWHVCVCVSV